MLAWTLASSPEPAQQSFARPILKQHFQILSKTRVTSGKNSFEESSFRGLRPLLYANPVLFTVWPFLREVSLSNSSKFLLLARLGQWPTLDWFGPPCIHLERTLYTLCVHLVRTLTAPRVHLECTLNTPWVHFDCTLNAPLVHLEYTLSTPWVHLESTLIAPWIRLESTLRAPWVHLERILSALREHLESTLGAPWAHLECTLNAWGAMLVVVG